MKHFYGSKVESNAAALHRPGHVAVFGDPAVVPAGQGVGCWPRVGGGQGAAKHPATSTRASTAGTHAAQMPPVLRRVSSDLKD